MNDLIDLYEYAQAHGVGVYWIELGCAESLSYCDPEGGCHIAMDPWRLHTVEEEKTKLGHELGHCCTGSFYNRWAVCDVRRKHENRADKWAVLHLITKEDLDKAVADGHTELWDLADHFGVTEDFMRKVVCWYTHGNLAVDEYMSY